MNLLVKRLTAVEARWFALQRRATSEALRGPRFSSRMIDAALGLHGQGPVSIRVRWFDGQRLIEQRRLLERRGAAWRIAGGPLPSRHLSRLREGDVLVVLFDSARSVTGKREWIVTVDTWRGRELKDEELRPVLVETLAGKAARVLRGCEDHPLYLLARRQLPAFGGGAGEVQNLAPREYEEARGWLVKYVRVSAMRRLLHMQADPVVDEIIGLLGEQGTRPNRRELAEALLNRYGTDLLVDRGRRRLVLAERFRERVPPRNPEVWRRGSKAARQFVRALGLPMAMAGLPVQPTPDFEDLPAMPGLGELHDYQRQIAQGLREVLAAQRWDERRAVVWLPTGTGKTRVCVETLLMELSMDAPRNVILWIADREELCEQAIATFRRVWMIRGTETPMGRNLPSPTLRVVRLWGGRPWHELSSVPTLLVASIQTLAHRVDTPAFERRLARLGERCAAVVFDEAHHVVAPSYARVLQALGLGRRRNSLGRDRSTSGAPLLGLTATPGRSSTDETERLAAAFSGRLLEPQSPYRSIRGFIERGFLAQPRLEVVSTGYALQQAVDDDDAWAKYQTLPTGTLREAGRNPARTALIVRDIEARLADLRSVLVFACSVEHAETIAEILSRRGHRAEALHGDSPHAMRVSTIRRFRERIVRVLVSCDLLTTGFDAPNVDAVALARPVESPVLFAQMVGRGLRGPRNGGTESCVIIDYEDNIGPFRSLEKLRAQFRSGFVDAPVAMEESAA